MKATFEGQTGRTVSVENDVDLLLRGDGEPEGMGARCRLCGCEAEPDELLGGEGDCEDCASPAEPRALRCEHCGGALEDLGGVLLCRECVHAAAFEMDNGD